MIQTKKHINGAPFKKIHETKNTISFLSIDQPSKNNIHILIIPKKEIEHFHNLPKNLRVELADHLHTLTKKLASKNLEYNILLNDGYDAGQRVRHVHFHLIVRLPEDKIQIELWKHKILKKDRFEKAHKRIMKILKG